jgi:eukaryotic-like serine/threonine-protein kinase
MALSPGTRLGSYEVSASIGAGGMGEVYRARDTRLGREVALKLLPPSVADDPDRLMRFEREARTLAALNHPNIAQIYGVEESGGQRALVMELVDGLTLEDVFFGSAPPAIADVISWFRQIAEALEAAHDAGVIHRDLKPANVKVRPDGTVKVLDFGLAKAQASGTEDSGAASLGPTMTSPAMTAMGVILGTAAYMAPEQARGRTVDRRADIWAFGVMLHEALTGQRGFGGETISDTIAAVLTRSLDSAALPLSTPAAVRTLIARCLEKDPRRRLRDIGEARLILEAPGADSGAPAPPPSASRPGSGLIAGVAVVSAVAAALAAWALLPSGQAESTSAVTTRSHIAILPQDIVIRGGAISPDGRAYLYAAGGKWWVQRMDQWEGRELVSLTTPGAAWSPRGDAIAYVTDAGQIQTIEVGGGTPRTVARLPPRRDAPISSVGITWSEDNQVVVTLGEGPLYAVSAMGGDLRPIVDPPPSTDARGHTDFHVPAPIPGRAELLALLHRDGGTDAIVVVNASDGSSRIVLDTPGMNMTRVVFSPTGHLVFARAEDQTLWAVPFSLDQMETTDTPFTLGPGRSPSIGPDGTLFYVSDDLESADRQLAWVSRTGQITRTVVRQRGWGSGVVPSPDGRKAVAALEDGLWHFDLATGTRSRLTANRGDRTPVWLPDGRVAFARVIGDSESIYLVRSTGGPEVLVTDNGRAPTVDASGKYLVFNSRRSAGRFASWVDPDKPSDVHDLAGLSNARFPSVSPDGTLLAYISNETGQDEVWVTRFPSGEGRWQLSSNQGGFANWSASGDELFFRGTGNDMAPWMMSVRVSGGAEPSFSRPAELFAWGRNWGLQYGVAADAQSFLALVGPNASIASSVRMVRNWLAEYQTP